MTLSSSGAAEQSRARLSVWFEGFPERLVQRRRGDLRRIAELVQPGPQCRLRGGEGVAQAPRREAGRGDLVEHLPGQGDAVETRGSSVVDAVPLVREPVVQQDHAA